MSKVFGFIGLIAGLGIFTIPASGDTTWVSGITTSNSSQENPSESVIVPPSNLTIQVAGADSLSVKLMWTASPDTVDGYFIYRNAGVIDSTIDTFYIDESYMVGDYCVTAYRDTEESDCSNTVTSIPVLTLNITIYALSDTQPSGCGWNILGGEGVAYNMVDSINAESVDIYLDYISGYFHLLSPDLCTIPANWHTTGICDTIMTTQLDEIKTAPPLGHGQYFNMSEVVISACYVLCTRVETGIIHFVKIKVIDASLSPGRVVLKSAFQLVPGLRLFESITGVEEKNVNCKLQNAKLEVYPNPSFGNAVIKYGLPEKARISLRLYDISGRLVKTIYSGVQDKGYHKIEIKDEHMGSPLPKGVYFIRFKAGNFESTNKLILM